MNTKKDMGVSRMSKLYCPLKDSGYCYEENCAWYDFELRDCAVLLIANELWEIRNKGVSRNDK